MSVNNVETSYNLPRFCNSSLDIWLLICADVGVGGIERCAGAGLFPGYHAQPPDCPLNIRSLSYTDSFCTDCCSFCDARFLSTRLIDETFI